MSGTNRFWSQSRSEKNFWSRPGHGSNLAGTIMSISRKTYARLLSRTIQTISGRYPVAKAGEVFFVNSNAGVFCFRFYPI